MPRDRAPLEAAGLPPRFLHSTPRIYARRRSLRTTTTRSLADVLAKTRRATLNRAVRKRARNDVVYGGRRYRMPFDGTHSITPILIVVVYLSSSIKDFGTNTAGRDFPVGRVLGTPKGPE